LYKKITVKKLAQSLSTIQPENQHYGVRHAKDLPEVADY
jgi:hypothetical protein